MDNKPFLYKPVKNKQNAYKKLVKISRSDNYKAGNLSGYSCHQNYYKLSGIGLFIKANK